MHMSDPDEKAWIRDRIEGPEKDITFTENGKRAILIRLYKQRVLKNIYILNLLVLKDLVLMGESH